MLHPSHPQHRLSYVQHGKAYICDGCEMWGKESSYRCLDCNFDLHRSCATAHPVLEHRFHSGNGHCLQFHTTPPRGTPMCSACAQTVSVFGYHCTNISCGYALHPTCATLSQTPPDPLNPTQILHLAHFLSFPCSVCREQGPGWAYVAASGSYNFHVACVGSISRDSNHIEVGTAPRELHGTRDRRIPDQPTSSSYASATLQSGGGGQIPGQYVPPPYTASPTPQSGGGGQIPGQSVPPYTASPIQQSGRRGFGLNTAWSVSNLVCEVTTAVVNGQPTGIIGTVASLLSDSN